jgi:uncharacterized membrane protein
MFAFGAWHLFVLVAVVIVALVIVGGVIAIVVIAVRSGSRGGSAEVRPDATARLEQLDALRAGGLITESEFEAQRRRILDEI